MKQFWKVLDGLVNFLLALGILGVAVVCFAQIVARSIFNSSIMWSGEASLLPVCICGIPGSRGLDKR